VPPGLASHTTHSQSAFVSSTGNAHIRAAYHWLKDTIRDAEFDLRDTASLLNLADFLTKVVSGPAMRQAIPPALKYL
jgi:hypothetical protein